MDIYQWIWVWGMPVAMLLSMLGMRMRDKKASEDDIFLAFVFSVAWPFAVLMVVCGFAINFCLNIVNAGKD